MDWMEWQHTVILLNAKRANHSTWVRVHCNTAWLDGDGKYTNFKLTGKKIRECIRLTQWTRENSCCCRCCDTEHWILMTMMMTMMIFFIVRPERDRLKKKWFGFYCGASHFFKMYILLSIAGCMCIRIGTHIDRYFDM